MILLDSRHPVTKRCWCGKRHCFTSDSQLQPNAPTTSKQIAEMITTMHHLVNNSYTNFEHPLPNYGQRARATRLGKALWTNKDAETNTWHMVRAIPNTDQDHVAHIVMQSQPRQQPRFIDQNLNTHNGTSGHLGSKNWLKAANQISRARTPRPLSPNAHLQRPYWLRPWRPKQRAPRSCSLITIEKTLNTKTIWPMTTMGYLGATITDASWGYTTMKVHNTITTNQSMVSMVDMVTPGQKYKNWAIDSWGRKNAKKSKLSEKFYFLILQHY